VHVPPWVTFADTEEALQPILDEYEKKSEKGKSMCSLKSSGFQVCKEAAAWWWVGLREGK
jgi:hypothetical protein